MRKVIAHLDWAQELHGQVDGARGYDEGALGRRELCARISEPTHFAQYSAPTVILFCTDFWKLTLGTEGAPKKLYVVPSTLTNPAHPSICAFRSAHPRCHAPSEEPTH